MPRRRRNTAGVAADRKAVANALQEIATALYGIYLDRQHESRCSIVRALAEAQAAFRAAEPRFTATFVHSDGLAPHSDTTLALYECSRNADAVGAALTIVAGADATLCDFLSPMRDVPVMTDAHKIVLLEVLIVGASLTWRADYVMVLLASKNRCDILALLLAAGFDPNCMPATLRLEPIARANDRLELVRLLLDYGVRTTEFPQTPFGLYWNRLYTVPQALTRRPYDAITSVVSDENGAKYARVIAVLLRHGAGCPRPAILRAVGTNVSFVYAAMHEEAWDRRQAAIACFTSYWEE